MRPSCSLDCHHLLSYILQMNTYVKKAGQLKYAGSYLVKVQIYVAKPALLFSPTWARACSSFNSVVTGIEIESTRNPTEF